MHEMRDILESLASGQITVQQAEIELRKRFIEKVGEIGVIDHSRKDRVGVPEVVFAQTKREEEIAAITRAMVGTNGFALLTRMNREKMRYLAAHLQDYEFRTMGPDEHLTVIVHARDWRPRKSGGRIAILTAGTSDIPYAYEAQAIAELMGVEVMSFYDVGVAGMHRLIEPLKSILEMNVDAVIVMAGMEGALPTVIASLIDIPVIGVPIPVGYGYGGGGKTALAAMLQSCALGLAVVNIGNGVGAGALAARIAIRAARR